MHRPTNSPGHGGPRSSFFPYSGTSRKSATTIWYSSTFAWLRRKRCLPELSLYVHCLHCCCAALWAPLHKPPAPSLQWRAMARLDTTVTISPPRPPGSATRSVSPSILPAIYISLMKRIGPFVKSLPPPERFRRSLVRESLGSMAITFPPPPRSSAIREAYL